MRHRSLTHFALMGLLIAGCESAKTPPSASPPPSEAHQADARISNKGPSHDGSSSGSTVESSNHRNPQVVPDAWGGFPKDVFFEDPFHELGENEPSFETNATAQETSEVAEAAMTTGRSDVATNPVAIPNDQTSDPNVVWSELVPTEVLLEETTRLRRALAGGLSSVAQYNENWKTVRVEASVLAVLGGIAALHEGPIPWKSRATAIRDTAAELASSVRGLGESSQKPAQKHYTKIRDLLIGKQPPESDPILDMPWSNVADRSQLMRRMKLAQDDRIKPFVSDARNFRKNSDEIAHEAALLAALAQVISTSYDQSDDEAYRNYCHTLRDQNKGLAQAARDGNFSRAAELAGANLKTCNACHAEFRFEGSQF